MAKDSQSPLAQIPVQNLPKRQDGFWKLRKISQLGMREKNFIQQKSKGLYFVRFPTNHFYNVVVSFFIKNCLGFSLLFDRLLPFV